MAVEFDVGLVLIELKGIFGLCRERPFKLLVS